MPRPDQLWETARLVAKRAVTRDAQLVFSQYASDPEGAKYMTWRPPRSVDETLECLRRCERVWNDGSAFPWTLWRKQDDEFAGMIEARVGAQSVDVGYAMVRRFWRRGLMCEAVSAVINWALAQPEIWRAASLERPSESERDATRLLLLFNRQGELTEAPSVESASAPTASVREHPSASVPSTPRR